jgi:FkbM family methyltransferase
VVKESHPDVFDSRYRIGVWAWELEDFPSWQHDAFELLDEIWTISEFCRRAIAKHSPIPVKVIPVPVRDPGQPPVRTRTPGRPVRFLFIFDFNSTVQRKNPLGLIKAFQLAFGDRSDVRLTIKATNGKRHPNAAEELRAAVAGDERIELLERYLSVAELDELYSASDCYVSLHRSEGFGLTVAEAMARAMPVISTDYSSTPEFLNARVGWPIPYRMTTVPPGSEPYHEGAAWAEPDLIAAAYAMREVAFNPAEAARRGQAARAHILSTRSARAAASWMRTELETAHATWRQRGKAGRRTTESAPRRMIPEPSSDGPLAPLHAARQALHWVPDVHSDSRVPLAPALRRAVLRALDHYDVHQRRVMGALTDGMEGTLNRILARLDALDARPANQPDYLAAAQLRSAQERIDELQRAVSSFSAQLAELTPEAASLRAGLAEEADRRASELAQLSKNLIPPATLDELRGAVAETEQRVLEQLRDRDRRADATEFLLGQVRRDADALHEAARLRHVPIPASAEVVVCDAGVLLVPHDKVILPALRLDRSWEPAEAALLAQLAGAGTVLDIGAHVGYHTLRLLRECPGVARVIAVEANQATVELLRRNISVNLPRAMAERVTVLPVAAWDSDGELGLVAGEPGNSGDYRIVGGGEAAQTVPVVRLDGYTEIASADVTLVKTDLQGRDHRAIAGLSQVIATTRPHIVCEFWPSGIAELDDEPAVVLSGYRALGYRPVPLSADGPQPGRYTDDDLISSASAAAGGFLSLWLQPR